MADVINLRRARKEKQRRTREQEAAEARLRHGRTKGERAIAEAEEDRAVRHLEQSRRETGE